MTTEPNEKQRLTLSEFAEKVCGIACAPIGRPWAEKVAAVREALAAREAQSAPSHCPFCGQNLEGQELPLWKESQVREPAEEDWAQELAMRIALGTYAVTDIANDIRAAAAERERKARLEYLLKLMGEWHLLAKVKANPSADSCWDVKVVADRMSLEAELAALAPTPLPQNRSATGENQVP